MAETREEVIASLKTRNGISIGDEVIFVGPSTVMPKQNLLAQARLRGNVKYTVTWIFPGDEFEQVELKEFPNDSWVHDMFLRIPAR